MNQRNRSVGAGRINLRIGEQNIGVACQDPTGEAAIRATFVDLLTNDEAEIGFLLSCPEDRDGLHVLSDRTGYVVARLRTMEQALMTLGQHLSVFLAPPLDSFRLQLRALVSTTDEVTLFPWPLLYTPPLIERRLQKTGHRVIDRLVADVDGAGASLVASRLATPDLEIGEPAVGHRGPPDSPLPITSVMQCTAPGMGAPSEAQLVQSLSPINDGSHSVASCFELAQNLRESLEIVGVPITEQHAIYRVLGERR